MTKIKLYVTALAVVLGIGGMIFLFNNRSSAVTAGDWKAGNIVNDYLFTNADDMSVNDIQAFLNSINPHCDTNGTQPASDYGRPDLTHAQYAASRGWPGPPYICLKDYYEVPKTSPGDFIPANNFSGSIPHGAISAAQIIYNAAKRHNINPKAILVKIATESAGPLTSDTWPTRNQYTYAMGSHCPDSGPGGSANCDRNYAGFSMQVESGTALLRWYLDNMDKPWWRYKKPFQTNSILWNVPQRGCGAGDVYIESRATAALYTYTPYQPNQASLNNMYGTGDHCSAYGNRNFWRVWNDWFGSTQDSRSLISFKSHVTDHGWLGTVHNRGITGTTGQGKSMQALYINGDVEYSSYSDERGWQPMVHGGMESGTTGLNRPIRAVKIQPRGLLAQKYNIYYRAHVSNIGWMGWARNGEPAGSTSSSNNIEALEIKLIKKGEATEATGNSFVDTGTKSDPSPLAVSIGSHVGNIGWQPTVTDEMTTGTTGQGYHMEAVKASLINKTGLSGTLRYSSHVAYIGWQNWGDADSLSGTTGQAKQMEAVRFLLTDQLAEKYDIYYRAHVAHIGWMGWARNGEPAGSVGVGRQLEAVQIRIAPKNSLILSSVGAFYNPKSTLVPAPTSLNYSAHVSDIGWPSVAQGAIAGTTGQSRSVEAIRITQSVNLINDASIPISCTAKSKGKWLPSALSTTPNAICGTTGQAQPLESIRLSITDPVFAQKYDIYYRTHLSWVGWQNWKKNNEISGEISGSSIEAIEIKLVNK